MSKLSVVISAFNEEKKIKDCLDSVKWADEIIFIDNSSTDKTLEIVKKFGTKTFIKENNPMLNVNKNFGISKATGNWILYLDADEQVTPELKNEIISTLNPPAGGQLSTVDGYRLPRKNIIFGKWIEHCGWYPDYQVRLFKKGKGKFPEKHVHEMIEVPGKVLDLKNHLIHFNFETISQFLHKHINIYAPNEAEQLIKNGYVFNWQDAIRFPAKEFLSRFFAREGYKDGFYGLMLSVLMAFYHLVIFAIIWEKYGFEDIQEKDFLSETEKEFKKAHKDLGFWFSLGKVRSIKNPIKKQGYRILRKIRLMYGV